jgi:hypothetical protein
MFAFGGENVTRGNHKNLIDDKLTPSLTNPLPNPNCSLTARILKRLDDGKPLVPDSTSGSED